MVTNLVDLLLIQGVDREIVTFLPLRDVARLARTCKSTVFHYDWMLDRELLIQLRCPEELRNKILDQHRNLRIETSSRLVKPRIATSVWDALKPFFENTPIKWCYGLKLTIEEPKVSFDLDFSNEVLCHALDITIVKSRYHSSTNFLVKPEDLDCVCLERQCCFGETPSKYYYVQGQYRKGRYYCKACLEHNCFVKLRKIRQHPGSYVFWNEVQTKL